MKPTMGNILAVAFLLCPLSIPAHAQTRVVTQPVNMIVDPASDNSPIRLLFPPETCKIAPKEQGGFFQVKTEASETGRVLKNAVTIYSRTDWMKNWDDADNDCQDTRQEVLI